MKKKFLPLKSDHFIETLDSCLHSHVLLVFGRTFYCPNLDVIKYPEVWKLELKYQKLIFMVQGVQWVQSKISECLKLNTYTGCFVKKLMFIL